MDDDELIARIASGRAADGGDMALRELAAVQLAVTGANLDGGALGLDVHQRSAS